MPSAGLRAVPTAAAASALPRAARRAPAPTSRPRPVQWSAGRPRGGGPEGSRRAVAAAHWPWWTSLTHIANGKRPGRGCRFGFFHGGGGEQRKAGPAGGGAGTLGSQPVCCPGPLGVLLRGESSAGRFYLSSLFCTPPTRLLLASVRPPPFLSRGSVTRPQGTHGAGS